MAVTITPTLVNQGVNSLRYLLTAAGAGTGSIIAAGAATPDLLTDALAGQLKQIMNVVAAGLGQLAAGVQTQAKARAILLSDNTGANIGSFDVPRAVVTLTPRAGAGGDWLVDADVTGGGVPQLSLTAAAAGTCYLDIEVLGAIGR